MKTLSLQRFRLAADFVHTHARLVDQRLFEYYFTNGSSEDVMEALVPYQNEDGGVGHGIEPDIRMKASSPIATSVALQYAKAVNAKGSHPFIQKAMNYLSSVYAESGFWPLKLKAMNNEPHAEWWHFTEPATTFEINPGAEILGYFHSYPQILEQDLFPIWHEQVFTYLEDAEKLDMHESLAYMRLSQMMPSPGKNQLIDMIKPHIRKVVTTDPSKWGAYCAKPLWFAPNPESPFFPMFEESVIKNLDYEIATQDKNGAWSPSWEWKQYGDVWESQARKDWQGELTVKTLRYLASYNRIEGLNSSSEGAV
ncbi:hypothetical protein [Alteribacter keqinensis]|uniref:Uncharacterized protein n=1 Tax=Alteribacter keqinensis TaxID=2483800 RepID=A0A3M7TP03_9BACI|nr:hypothetical protein [Alteribacter keqinensis]RNA66747.1 hypothetical protein EBO34_16165 [Alteribacter keqinensis]